MRVILLERVEGLGNVGDEVQVKPGYARNYLIPKGKATPATPANRKAFERRRALLEAKQRQILEQAKQLAEKMQGTKIVVRRATSDGTHLYGSVTPSDLMEALAEAGFEVKRSQILLDQPIKTIGEHRFRVRLHPDVTAELRVQVEPEGH